MRHLYIFASIILFLSMPIYADQKEPIIKVFINNKWNDFSIADLETLGVVEVNTFTSWTEGEQYFEGIPIANFLKLIKLEDQEIAKIHGLDGYAPDVPIKTLLEHNAVIAIKHNGKYMNVRNKGPFWVIFPRNSQRFTSELDYYSVWSVEKIIIK